MPKKISAGFKVSNYNQDSESFSIKLETLEADVFKQLRNKAKQQLHTHPRKLHLNI